MILSFARKYQKGIAAFMLTVFSAQLTLPAMAGDYEPFYHSDLYAKNPNDRKENISLSTLRTASGLDVKTAKFDPAALQSAASINYRRPFKQNIGGPGQPEMSSFSSVNSNNMVDLFTGDFSYNIPLMDVGGYPVNIHYAAGVSMDQESSWVGLGWNINPGTITRNMRGLPDDFNGTDSITKTQNIKQNKTVGVKLGGQAEIAGAPLSVGGGFGVFHNNYNGWGIEQSLNASVSLGRKNQNDLNSKDSLYARGPVKLGGAFNNNSQNGLSVNPSLNVTLKKYDKEQQLSSATNFGINTGYHTRGGLSSLTINATRQKYQPSLFKPNPMSGISDVNISFAHPSVTPFISMPTTSSNFTFHGKVGGELFGFHGNVFVEGYVNKQFIKKEDQTQKLPAYGFLYYTDANNNNRALLDFNREKELQFNYQSTPHIAIPQYTYDIYTISGEGTGGTIRPYRGDVGMIKDHYMRTRSENNQFSLEVGAGNMFHGGFSYDFVNAYSENTSWIGQNSMSQNLVFQTIDSLYQPVYFRNPGEKTSNTSAYYQQIGDDELMRVQLNRKNLSSVTATNNFVRFKNGRSAGVLPVAGTIKKQDRDKRGQVITYLKANEAVLYGFEKNIYSYKENTLPLATCKDDVDTIQRIDAVVRKNNHLSEIDVLNPDGRRYIYGIPAYNIEQQDVTFSVKKEENASDLDSGFVNYAVGSDNATKNNKGKESYFNKEQVPAYAHSFLLSAIVSPDYVDVKEDGITEDDLGDAVKFNYTRIYGPKEDYFAWRTPGTYGKGTYNEGLKTYSRDDKATYLYGKKEVWYAHSIESKTMIALFKLSADRKDAYAAAGENGGVNTNKTLRKLDKIELYSKADLLKNGLSARPVKTVNFEYSYDLCKNVNGQGKLTLKRIWFSYNGNQKGKQNPYVFSYAQTNAGYHPKKYDRWGNFKDAASNPGGLSNADYPYAVQDSNIAAQNAGVWQLNGIKLPSGGNMKITYESDDYAFVQNKRATQMFTIGGFGTTPSATPVNKLYDSKGDVENEYIFLNTNLAIADANEVFKKYLEGNEWLYLKLAVTMPTDRWGSGFEFVPLYGKIQSFGKVNGANRFWVKFEKVDGISPMIRNTFQFLKNNLASKAYPTSELGDDVDLGDAVKMLLSSISEIKNSVLGFEKSAMTKGWCKEVILPKSFIRLNAPEYKKLGGGHRVKRIEIFDNWNAMTKQRESVYGQEYEYKTSIEINGKKQIISSGVASYEPMIGGEENPFRQPINYAEKLAALAPVAYLYSEMPLGESYYPGASVGYSKVRVRTINAKAKSANGWEETEFFTSKDFPTLVEHTLLDQEAKTRYSPKIQNLLKIYSVQRTTVSQGFKIELNDMSGKVKRTASYAETDSLNPVAYTQNYYKVDDDRAVVPKLNNTVWVVDSATGKINKNGIIGKDIELITDFRQQYSSSISGGVSPNLDYFQIGIFPVPIPSFFKFPQFDESQFRSAATVKVIQRYGILDSVIVKDKSSVVSTKNLLYDGETGEVVLSRTKNEFNDPVYNFSYPAHWAYSGMGMAYKNVQAEFTNLNLINGKLYYRGTDQSFPCEKYFESGDELWLTGNRAMVLPGENCLKLSRLPFPFPRFISQKVWAIEASKGVQKDVGIYFIDKNGNPVTAEVSLLKVLRSGKRNLLNGSVGSIVSLNNPIREISPGNYQLLLDSTLNVINASAAAYKDLWKVDQSLYEKDTVVRVVRTYGPFLFTPTVTTKRLDLKGSGALQEDSYISNSELVAASYDYVPGATCRSSRSLYTKSLLRFDFTQIPSDATITSAYIQLTPKVPTTLWWRKRNTGDFTCKDNYSYDWSTSTSYYLGNSEARLKRITGNWNDVFPYRSIVSTSTNEVSVTTGNYNYADCKNLIQDIVRNVNYGLSYEIVDNNRDNDKRNETNYLSFCGRDNTTSGLPCNNTLSKTSTESTLAAALPNCNCNKPQLYISWSVTVDTTIKVCRNNITDTINPYRWGILGNWRMDRAFSYYSDRKESDAASSKTDIRKEGTLKNFTTYWRFSNSSLVANGDTTKWVWNSSMSSFNHKGFETENYDPLQRYNAGLYGYNQTLPVAVAQNAKYREILSDGFEDYDYKTKDCISCATPREIDFRKGQANVTVSDEDAHTGRYSLKVNAYAESRLSIPLTEQKEERTASWFVRVDSTPVYGVTIIGKGKGLSAIYSGGLTLPNGSCNSKFTATISTINPQINYNWGNQSPYPGSICLRNTLGRYDYEVNWSGFVQAKISGNYRFHLEKTTGLASLRIAKGTTVLAQNIVSQATGPSITTVQIYLQAGELYNITASFSKAYRAAAAIQLTWQLENAPFEVVPQQYLYPTTMTAGDTIGSIKRDVTLYCIATRNDSVRNVIRPVFSPTRGSKTVLSAWVKMGGADCSIAPALTDVVMASFNDNTSVSLQKTGVRIEGWQRYESIVDIPLAATTLYISLKGVQGRTIYVDDIRMQPYNSSMKSYVYDPISLRLMADLDENNYATYYEYDDDGTLTRLKKETEKGVQTIKETRSALIKN